MSERLTDEELDRLRAEFPTHMGEPVASVLVQRAVSEIRDRREKAMNHAANHCLDCEGPLVPCTCQPDCPGGMCARECYLPFRTRSLTPEDIESLKDAEALLTIALVHCKEAGQSKGEQSAARILSVLARLINEGKP